MNEELLLKLYETLGLQGKGDFETFKNDISNNPELQLKAYNKLTEIKGKKGEFEQFQSDFGFGAEPKKASSKPSLQFSPEQHALLDAISDVEAPDYNVIVGGGRFDDFSDHPRKVGVVTEYGPSTAAGKLQFTASTWDEINKVLKLPDFGPDSQNIAGLYYAETRYKDLTGGRDIYEDISAGRLETIQQVLGGSGGSTVWQGLQGDTEFAERYKGHLKRYQDQVKPPEPKTMQEVAQDLESAMQGNKEMAANLQYNLGETTVEPTPKKVPEDMGKIKERLDQERVSLKAVDHDFKQKVSTRQDELRQQFEATPIFSEMNQKYTAEVQAQQDKFIKENVETSPEYIGMRQKLQDDVNNRVVTPEEASQKINEFISERVAAEPSLKDLDVDINKRFSDEYNSVFQGYTSKDDILGSLIKQREDIWGQSTAFQTELINSYNSKIEEYNKQAQSQAQANQPKASKEAGLQGGGPYAPGKKPQDYTGGLIKINKTSSDYDKDLEELDSKVGLKKDAALAAWYTDQGREVPTQKAKDLTKKSTEYFKKGKEIKLKRYEALKQEIFTMSPIELGRAKIEDFTQKAQEYGDIQRGYFEQDNVAVQAYADELVKFREGADLKLSEKFGDKYNEFLEDQAALEIQIKAGKDVKDKVKNFQDKYSDVLEDDDYLLSSREIPKLYQQAKFEQSQLADAYQQGERLKRVEETQKYANENPVLAAIAGTIGKAIGAVVQTTGSLLEQAEKAPMFTKLIPGFAQLSGFLPVGEAISELGEMGRVAGGDIIAGTPFSTKMQGQSRETYATTPTGKRVVYSPDTGEVQYIRNEDGTIYEGYEAETIIKSAEGLKKQTGTNVFSLAGQMLDIVSYMVPTVALSYGTAGMGTAAGLGATGLNAMSKIGMFMGGYSQGYSQAKEEALKQKGLSLDEIEVFSATTGIMTGVIENFNPIEGQIFSKSLSKNVIKDNLLELASGRVSGAAWGTNFTLGALKGGFKESMLEEVPQAMVETGLKNYYNSKKGSEFVANISSDQWKDIILTSALMGGIGDAMRSGKKSDLGKEALKTIVNNREMYDAYLSGMEKTSPEMAAKIRGDIDPLLSEIDSVDGLTPRRKEKSVELLFDIRTLESKLAPITEPTLRKPIEDKIVELRKELGSIVSVPTDDYGDPVDEVAEAEKAAKEAEKTKGEVSKSATKPTPKKPEEPPTPSAGGVAVETSTTKPTKDAIQEQKTTEVPVQSEAKSSGTDTQGQPQPESQGTAQQGQAQEQAQGEEITKPTQEQIADDVKNKRFSTLTFNSVEEVPEQLKDKVSTVGETNGKTQVKVTLPSSEMDYILSTIEGSKKSPEPLQSTQTTEQGVPTTKGEKVAPAQPQWSQKAAPTLDELKAEIDAIEKRKKKELNLNVTKFDTSDPVQMEQLQANRSQIISKYDKELAPLKEALQAAQTETKTTPTKETTTQPTQQPYELTYANGRTTPAVVKDGKWFLPETGAKNEDGTYQGVFASDAQVKQLNEKFGSADKVAGKADAPPKTQPAAEPKKAQPKASKTDSEIKRVQDEIDYIERQIEDFQAEIANEKENVKADIKEVRDKIAKVRSSNASKSAKEDRIEELKGEIEDIQDNYEGIVEQYKNDIEDNRKDLKKLKRELAKLEETKKAEVAVEPTPAAAKTEATPTKDKETLEEAVQRVDSNSIIQLDDIINRAEKDLENTKDTAKKEDIQKTIDSLKKTRDQLSNTQTKAQTKDESIKSESKTSSKGEEGKVGTTVAQEQGKGLGEEVSTQEEVTKESLQTKDPTQKAAQDLVIDSKKTIDKMSQDQAAAILDYMKGLKIDIPGLKIDCKK